MTVIINKNMRTQLSETSREKFKLNGVGDSYFLSSKKNKSTSGRRAVCFFPDKKAWRFNLASVIPGTGSGPGRERRRAGRFYNWEQRFDKVRKWDENVPKPQWENPSSRSEGIHLLEHVRVCICVCKALVRNVSNKYWKARKWNETTLMFAWKCDLTQSLWQ